jgi:hypothetical protein
LGEYSAGVFENEAGFGNASGTDREGKIDSKSRLHRKNERMEFSSGFPGGEHDITEIPSERHHALLETPTK